MTPGEVKGLQQLAMAYGGSLSTNPETGLPEAGFLKSLLPTLIGAGLMMVPGMQGVGAGFLGGTAGMIGAGVGALEFARTGDLGKGLMAGLGAYSGAGLASGALAAGAATGQAGATIPAEELAKAQAIGSAPISTPPQFAPPETFMGNLSQAGSGVSNILSTGSTGQVARDAAMQGFKDTGVQYAGLGSPTAAAMKTVGALAGPLSQPAPMPEVEEVEYNYDGPYKPTERKVRYPGPDRDPTDSSEFQYFDVVNPSPGFEPIASSTPLPENTYGPDAPRFAGIPVEIATDPERMRDYQQNPDLYSFAEGGGAKIAPTSYVAGRDAEFDYGFQPMANVPSTQPVQGQMQGVSGLPGYKTQSLADLQAQGKIGRGTGFAGTNLTGQQHQSSIINHFLNHPQIGPQLRADGYYAEGGEVDMHNNGFVVDAHTVSEVGNGSSNAGMERFARIGGQPIMGPGDGTSDSIPANIDGMQPAMVARDEVYMPPDAVAMYGGGSLKIGEKKLYALMEQARKSRKKNGRGQSTGLKQLVA